MPCSDSSSGFNLKVSLDDRFISSEYAKITCSSSIAAGPSMAGFCVGKSLQELLNIEFADLIYEIGQGMDEDAKVLIYFELQAMQACIALYLGVDHPALDKERCKISAIEHGEKHVDIALVILPPKELPKIIPCGMVDGKSGGCGCGGL